MAAKLPSPDEELISALEAGIKQGSIKVEDDSTVFEKMETKFPIDGRVDWTKLSSLHQFPSPAPKLALKKRLGKIAQALKDFAQTAEIAETAPLIIVGDNAFKVAVRMTLPALLDHLDPIFSWPQHVYVVTEDYEWCFCYTFEDDMFFGRSPWREPRVQRKARPIVAVTLEGGNHDIARADMMDLLRHAAGLSMRQAKEEIDQFILGRPILVYLDTLADAKRFAQKAKSFGVPSIDSAPPRPRSYRL